MGVRAELIGGPFDGVTLPEASRGTLIHLREVRQRSARAVRAFKADAPGREPYRFLERVANTEVYVYDGHLHIGSGYVICPGCEGHLALQDLTRCAYCGTDLRVG